MSTPPRVRRNSDAPSGPFVLDDLSKQIIEQLQSDGRMPYAAIGKAVGLSEAAVRQRVQRLTEAGVMQVVAVTDPLELGFDRQAMIGINAEGALEPIAAYERRPSSWSCSMIALEVLSSNAWFLSGFPVRTATLGSSQRHGA